jgi:hypothetical protein
MRLLDGEKQVALWNVQIYLTPAEAKELVARLNKLLVDPEANEHEHVLSTDSGREISVSLITPTKLKDLSGYTSAERKMFEESR